MAEGPDPREKPLEELEREITCTVCHGFYQQAKLLPCNHYYCSTCIEKMAARSGGVRLPRVYAAMATRINWSVPTRRVATSGGPAMPRLGHAPPHFEALSSYHGRVSSRRPVQLTN